MSQDRARELSPSDLPEPVGEWLADVAAERDIEEEELLGRLLAASDGTGTTVAEERLETVEERLATLEGIEDRVDRLAARTDELDAELDEKIDDVRDRVIQVKREADAKADADHDHPEIEQRLEEVSGEIEDLADALDDLEARLESGFGNSEAFREEVRAEVEEVTGDLDHKLNVLASAVLDVRDRVAELGNHRSRQEVVDRLQRAANRHGVESAKCEACEESIDVSLLSEPTCPHCEEHLRELDPKSGFFGSNVVRTGTPPALEGDVVEEDLDGLVEDR